MGKVKVNVLPTFKICSYIVHEIEKLVLPNSYVCLSLVTAFYLQIVVDMFAAF